MWFNNLKVFLLFLRNKCITLKVILIQTVLKKLCKTNKYK